MFKKAAKNIKSWNTYKKIGMGCFVISILSAVGIMAVNIFMG